jgi:hypothetical protein
LGISTHDLEDETGFSLSFIKKKNLEQWQVVDRNRRLHPRFDEIVQSLGGWAVLHDCDSPGQKLDDKGRTVVACELASAIRF